MADADHVKVLVEHVAPVSLAGIVFVGFLPGGKRFPRRVLPGRDVFPYGGVAARRERGETAVPIRSRVVKVHRDFRRALHGDLLQRVIIGQRAEVVYIDFRAVLIPHPCVAAGAELVAEIEAEAQPVRADQLFDVLAVGAQFFRCCRAVGHKTHEVL